MRLKLSGWGKYCGAWLIGLCILGIDLAAADSINDIPADKSKAAPARNDQSSFFNRNNSPWETEFNLTMGRRLDDLDWSIGRNANGGEPNVLSELAWSDVESRQLTLSNRSRFRRHLYFRGQFNWAWIQDGTVRDSDYGQNFRTAEWSRSISQTDGDEMWDLSGGGGYAFFLLNNRLIVAPLIGFSCHKQNLRITDGR